MAESETLDISQNRSEGHFLSRYLLNTNEARTLRLYDTYALHRVVYDLFEKNRLPGDEGHSGILFADKGARRGQREILVLSDRMPRQTGCGQMFTRAIPEDYLTGRIYRFAITVNPARRKNSTGRIEALRGRQEITQWFMDKAQANGFTVMQPGFQTVEIFADRFRKGENFITLCKANLDGWLEVTDRDLFINAALNGLGRGRAFGCGLLQIVPVQ